MTVNQANQVNAKASTIEFMTTDFSVADEVAFVA
jgi:hypothetical protein